MTLAAAAVAGCAPLESSLVFSSQGDIDRLGAEFCEKPHWFGAVKPVQQYRLFRMNCLATTLDIVNAAGMPDSCLVSARLKRLDSIRSKIQRPNANFTLGQMDDIVGVRVICRSFAEARELNGRIQSLPEFYRAKDYTRQPHGANTGYRAAHNVMKFRQPLSDNDFIDVRFEVQVRSVYQHKWALWSESKGAATQAGLGSEEENSELRAYSERIARWEENNPDNKQDELPAYVDNKNIAVVWRKRNVAPIFYDEMDEAVQYLNYLETKFSHERYNALLLVGASNPKEVQQVLRQTHPLYMQSSVAAPEHWMPPGS